MSVEDSAKLITTPAIARGLRDDRLEEVYGEAISSVEDAIAAWLGEARYDVFYAEVPVTVADRVRDAYRAAGWTVDPEPRRGGPRDQAQSAFLFSLPALVDGFHPERRQADGSPVLDFWRFVHERQQIWDRRVVRNQPRPWTDDPVLRDRFFTNIFRDLDPGTKVAMDIVNRHDRPAWERLWNLMVYRRFNREETWELIGYDELGGGWGEDLVAARDHLRELYLKISRYRAETGRPIFTDAHQVYPMPSIGGPADVTSRLMRVLLNLSDPARQPVSIFGLAETLRGAATRKEAYRALVNARIPGVSSFLSWQMTMDCTYGRDPIVTAKDDWAPITTGARFGAIMVKEWPEIGTVNYPVEGWPALPPTPPAELEAFVRGLRDEQDQRFAERGLDFFTVSGRRLDMAALEHALCEYSKYVAAAVGLPTRDRWAQPASRGSGSRQAFDELAEDTKAAVAAIDLEEFQQRGHELRVIVDSNLEDVEERGLEVIASGTVALDGPPTAKARPASAWDDATVAVRMREPAAPTPRVGAEERFRAAVRAIHDRGETPTSRLIFQELGMRSVSLNTRQAAWRRDELATLGYELVNNQYVRRD